MDPESSESQELLEETLGLARENNKMLLSMRRSFRIAHVMSFLYWIFIIGSAVGVYYYIQPYLEQLVSLYDGAKSNIDSINDVFQNLKR